MKERLFTRNFLLLMFGQVSSLFGNSILRLALSMYILDQTGSAAVFGSVLSAAVLPTILLSPLGGFLADRMNRRNLMVLLDALTGLAVLATALVLSCSDSIVPIVILLMLLSVLGAFETPAVQACIPSMLSGKPGSRHLWTGGASFGGPFVRCFWLGAGDVCQCPLLFCNSLVRMLYSFG